MGLGLFGRPVRASPPSRGRGLKHIVGFGMRFQVVSPPSRGRGLKLQEAEKLVNGDRRRPLRGGVD